MELTSGNISMSLHCNCRYRSEISLLGLAAKDITRQMQPLEGELIFKKAGNHLSELTVLLGHTWLFEQPYLNRSWFPVILPEHGCAWRLPEANCWNASVTTTRAVSVPHTFSSGTHPANVQGASKKCFSCTLLCKGLL